MADFIEVYDGLVDPALCAAICRRFDAAPHVDGRLGSGVFPELKKSRDVGITGIAEWNDVAAALMDALRHGAINLQRDTSGEGGYPHWHCELYPRDAAAETLHRTLLWTIYLNDGFDEGETEFLYQKCKIVPKTGSLLIAPAAFTHTHRGNRPVGRDKYIATSWVLFNRAEQIFGASG